MTKVTVKTKCGNCGAELARDRQGPCPNCNKEGREITAVQLDAVAIGEPSITTAHETRLEYYKQNPYALTIVAVIALGSPFLGLVLGDLPGFLIGLILSCVSYWVGRSASKTIVEITRTIRHD
jgi:uncharacterized OB-fold protein